MTGPDQAMLNRVAVAACDNLIDTSKELQENWIRWGSEQRLGQVDWLLAEVQSLYGVLVKEGVRRWSSA